MPCPALPHPLTHPPTPAQVHPSGSAPGRMALPAGGHAGELPGLHVLPLHALSPCLSRTPCLARLHLGRTRSCASCGSAMAGATLPSRPPCPALPPVTTCWGRHCSAWLPSRSALGQRAVCPASAHRWQAPCLMHASVGCCDSTPRSQQRGAERPLSSPLTTRPFAARLLVRAGLLHERHPDGQPVHGVQQLHSAVGQAGRLGQPLPPTSARPQLCPCPTASGASQRQ